MRGVHPGVFDDVSYIELLCPMDNVKVSHRIDIDNEVGRTVQKCFMWDLHIK